MHDSKIILVAAGLLALCACGGGGGGGAGHPMPPGASVTEIQFGGGVGPNGIFDPSLAVDGSGKLWMSYSEVSFSPTSRAQLYVRTRLASSDDRGASWADAGLVHDAGTFLVPQPLPNLPLEVVWEQEVSALAHDTADTDAARRWKMLWHRYTNVYDPNTGIDQPVHANGWVALKAASAPGGLATAVERKLFTGSLYDAANNDAIIGAPEYPLASLHPAALGGCAVFTEPGMLAVSDGVFVALRCAPLPGTWAVGKIVLLKCTHTAQRAFASCGYVGDLLTDAEAADFGAYDGLSAPELMAVGVRTYLIATPTVGDAYRGCLVFEVADLAGASLVRANGRAVVVKSINLASGAPHHGACGYHAAATASGVLYGEANPANIPMFRLFASGVGL